MKNYEINYENNQEGGREPENPLKFDLTKKPYGKMGKAVLKSKDQIKQQNKLQFIFIMNIINDITKKFVDILKLNKAPDSTDAFLKVSNLASTEVTNEDREYITEIFKKKPVNAAGIMKIIKGEVVTILNSIILNPPTVVSQTGGGVDELKREIKGIREIIQGLKDDVNTPVEDLQGIREKIITIKEKINSDNEITPDKKNELNQEISQLEQLSQVRQAAPTEQASEGQTAPPSTELPAPAPQPPASEQDDPPLVELPNKTNFINYILPSLKNYIENINIDEITKQIFEGEEGEGDKFFEEYKTANEVIKNTESTVTPTNIFTAQPASTSNLIRNSNTG